MGGLLGTMISYSPYLLSPHPANVLCVIFSFYNLILGQYPLGIKILVSASQ